ncbi:MAG: hypothetical protein AAB354_07470 [candidate division KSB1 bacterium]
MMPQLKDLFFKDVTQHHAREILDLLQLGGEYEVLDADRNKELIVRRRESDQVLKVRIGGKVHLFHLEFISRYSRHAVRKAYGFGGALTAKHNCDVITVLVVLKPPARPRTSLGYYEIAPLGDALNQHGFAVIDVAALRERILAGEKGLIGLVPILPEISARVDKKLLARQRELIRRVDDPKRQAELLFYTMAFNEPHFGLEFVQRYFAKETQNMTFAEKFIHLPALRNLFERHTREATREARNEGTQQGVKQGVKQGQALARQQDILYALRNRFGAVNGPIERGVNAISEPKRLEQLFKLALTAYSLQEFKSALTKKKAAARKRVTAR